MLFPRTILEIMITRALELYLGFGCIATLEVKVMMVDSFGFHEFDFLKSQDYIADFVDNSFNSAFVGIVKSFGVIAILAALLALAAIVAKSAIVDKSAIVYSLSNMEKIIGVDFENFEVVGGGVAETKNNFNETTLDVVVSKERENSF